jgi:hypothetical protein
MPPAESFLRTIVENYAIPLGHVGIEEFWSRSFHWVSQFSGFPSRGICYFRSVCACVFCCRCVFCWYLWSISNRKKMFLTRTNYLWICFVSVMELLFFSYTRMGLMVAVLPTHPRVSEVTCLRTNAKRQQDLTGTHAQTVSEKYCPEDSVEKRILMYGRSGSMCSQSLCFFVKSCACVLMLSRNEAWRNFFHTRADYFSLC